MLRFLGSGSMEGDWVSRLGVVSENEAVVMKHVMDSGR